MATCSSEQTLWERICHWAGILSLFSTLTLGTGVGAFYFSIREDRRGEESNSREKKIFDREQAADERQRRADLRDQQADDRQRIADIRDREADERDKRAFEITLKAADREEKAFEMQRAAYERDQENSRKEERYSCTIQHSSINEMEKPFLLCKPVNLEIKNVGRQTNDMHIEIAAQGLCLHKNPDVPGLVIADATYNLAIPSYNLANGETSHHIFSVHADSSSKADPKITIKNNNVLIMEFNYRWDENLKMFVLKR